jgi:acetyl esterase
MSVADVRRLVKERADFAGVMEPVAAVEDIRIPGPIGDVGARVYVPQRDGPLPILVYLHGSGWTVGDLDLFEGPCRALANASGWLVMSVDYRLSPEHHFPIPLEDCYAAVDWAAASGASIGGLPSLIAVCGSSSGGNLAAAVTLMARDRDGPALSGQVLIYPALDHRFDTISYRDMGPGNLPWYWQNYLGPRGDGENPYASPLRATSLASLPRALIITAEFDALREEGEAYAARLRSDGVSVSLSRYDGMIHGFFSMGGVFDRAGVAMKEIGAFLQSLPKVT